MLPRKVLGVVPIRERAAYATEITDTNLEYIVQKCSSQLGTVTGFNITVSVACFWVPRNRIGFDFPREAFVAHGRKGGRDTNSMHPLEG